MSLFGAAPAAPAAAPPPPPAPMLASPSISERGAAERTSLASAGGQGFNGNDLTGGQGSNPENTTGQVGQKSSGSKTLLGG